MSLRGSTVIRRARSSRARAPPCGAQYSSDGLGLVIDRLSDRLTRSELTVAQLWEVAAEEAQKSKAPRRKCRWNHRSCDNAQTEANLSDEVLPRGSRLVFLHVRR